MPCESSNLPDRREVAHKRDNNTPHQTSECVQCRAHHLHPRSPASKEIVNERVQEMVNMVKGRFIQTRDDANEIDIFEAIAKVDQEVVTDHVDDTN
jgi:hypothetical protein